MFIPRDPVVQNQFCSYGETSTTGGVGGVVAYAGSVVYLDSTATNQESIVFKMAHGITETPFGFSMQKVKTGYHQVHPTGMVLSGDLGSSDAIAQSKYSAAGVINGTKSVPVGVAHLGIWDTVHYTAAGTGGSSTVATTPSAAVLPGQALYPAADEAKVTNSTTNSDGTDYDGERCSTTVVARVVKGASVAKATATISNVSLYPIRIKLLI